MFRCTTFFDNTVENYKMLVEVFLKVNNKCEGRTQPRTARTFHRHCQNDMALKNKQNRRRGGQGQ